MKRSKSALAVALAVAALSGAGAFGATAAPLKDASGLAAAKAANVCTQGAASSGRKVPGQLSKAHVEKELGGQTATHRQARGWSKGHGAQNPLKQREPSQGAGPAEAIHPAQGTTFLKRDGNDGGCATQSVSTQVNVTEGSTAIYTPALYPAGSRVSSAWRQFHTPCPGTYSSSTSGSSVFT